MPGTNLPLLTLLPKLDGTLDEIHSGHSSHIGKIVVAKSLDKAFFFFPSAPVQNDSAGNSQDDEYPMGIK